MIARLRIDMVLRLNELCAAQGESHTQLARLAYIFYTLNPSRGPAIGEIALED